MTQWEYLHQVFHLDTLDVQMSELGYLGWEAIEVVFDWTPGRVGVMFKRPVERLN